MTTNTDLKRKFYIEYFPPLSKSDNPIADTFSIPVKHLEYFIGRMKKAGHSVVHLQLLEGNGKVLISERRTQHPPRRKFIAA
jgi:hypothetical protein